MIGRLRQCSRVGRPRGIKKFAVDKLRSVTPIMVSMLSTVEVVATLVIKHRIRKLFSSEAMILAVMNAIFAIA